MGQAVEGAGELLVRDAGDMGAGGFASLPMVCEVQVYADICAAGGKGRVLV